MPLVTTLQPRTNKVTEADFRDCSRLDVTDYNLNKIIPLWNASVNFTPQELFKIFQPAFQAGFRLELKFEEGSDLPIFSIYKPSLRENENHFSNYYDFSDPEQVVLEISDVRFEENLRGNGWGHKLDAMFTELNVALGIRIYTFGAVFENGAWMWPFKGYPMNLNPELDNRKPENVSKRVMERLRPLKGLIPQYIYDHAIQLAQFKNSRDVCELARMNFDLLPHLTLTLGGIILESQNLNDYFRDLTQSSWIKFKTLTDNLEEAISFSIQRDRIFTLGKYTLVGETIECVCDYDDDQQIHEIFGDGSVFRHTKFISSAPDHRPQYGSDHKPMLKL
jgi:hypothetical protein